MYTSGLLVELLEESAEEGRSLGLVVVSSVVPLPLQQVLIDTRIADPDPRSKTVTARDSSISPGPI